MEKENGNYYILIGYILGLYIGNILQVGGLSLCSFRESVLRFAGEVVSWGKGHQVQRLPWREALWRRAATVLVSGQGLVATSIHCLTVSMKEPRFQEIAADSIFGWFLCSLRWCRGKHIWTASFCLLLLRRSYC